jgi:hypothetical protein
VRGASCGGAGRKSGSFDEGVTHPSPSPANWTRCGKVLAREFAFSGQSSAIAVSSSILSLQKPDD